MNDPNRTMKWLLVVGLVVLSIVILYPPQQKLKGGIDLVGGTSLLFEIDTAGLQPAEHANLSGRVMEILKQRVDPQGQLNLEWRPVGNTRLEIRMPRPPKEARERRDAYNDALDQVKGMNLVRFDIESALNEAADKREAALAGLIRGVEERKALVEELKSSFDAYRAAQGADDPAAINTANQQYEAVMTRLLRTSLPIHRVTDVLSLPTGKRDEELKRLREEFPSYDGGAEGGAITRTVKAYDLWARNKAELEDPSDLKRKIRGAGVLEFRILADRDPASPQNTTAPVEPISKYVEQLQQRGPRPKAVDLYEWYPVENTLRFTNLKTLEELEKAKNQPGMPILEEYAGKFYALTSSGSRYAMLQSGERGARWSLMRARADQDYMTGQNVVNFLLDARGGQLFSELTGNNVGRQLCIMLDGQAMSHARINERISTSCQISGRFTPEQVFELVRILEAGSLPARVKETPLSENTIGPSLGETNRQKGMLASVIGLAATMSFMLLYYGIAGGGVANIALGMNLLLVLGSMALMQATFTLPGIAGLALSLGMAVDANVLIFERYREERERGVVFRKAINAGYDKAFSAIFDSNLTTILTCFILGFVGSEEVKGFAVTLGIGLAVSMFTALVVTRLLFNTMHDAGWLTQLRMMSLIPRPKVDWFALAKSSALIPVAATVLGVVAFAGRATTNKAAMFDIEFLGGTSVQVDLKGDERMKDAAMLEAVTSTEGNSASAWLARAAGHLQQAELRPAEQPGVYLLSTAELTGDELIAMVRPAIEGIVERDGLEVVDGALRIAPTNAATADVAISNALELAVRDVRAAADRLRTAKVQSVGEMESGNVARSFEIVTLETNRDLVQQALLEVLGPKLDVQQALSFEAMTDTAITRERFFVVETQDQYLRDVIGGDAPFDVRRFRGGVAIHVRLNEQGPSLTTTELENRLREVGLQPEFEQFRTLESGVFPLGGVIEGSEGKAYREFAVLAVDDQLLYDDGPELWTDALARVRLAQVTAALSSEKSFSKVVAFAPQVAEQARNRAIFAVILSMLAISAYLWLRFGSKDFGLAASVALVFDVCVTLGFIVISHVLYPTPLGPMLMLTDFKIDLPMIAGLLTLIGYSLNDKIVIFDRIRENRGKSGAFSGALISDSISQVLPRTILTSTATLLVLLVLYVAGGDGVHGFSYAMLIGIILGTYSSIFIAAPLLLVPAFLWRMVIVIVTAALVGVVVVEAETPAVRVVMSMIIAAFGAYVLYRDWAREKTSGGRMTAGAM